MENLSNADIFFIVTTVVVVVVGAAIAVTLHLLIRILREIKELSGLIYRDSKLALLELEDLGQSGRITKTIIKTIFSVVAGKVTRRKRKNSK